jgi:hypothetical protein
LFVAKLFGRLLYCKDEKNSKLLSYMPIKWSVVSFFLWLRWIYFIYCTNFDCKTCKCFCEMHKRTTCQYNKDTPTFQTSKTNISCLLNRKCFFFFIKISLLVLVGGPQIFRLWILVFDRLLQISLEGHCWKDNLMRFLYFYFISFDTDYCKLRIGPDQIFS